MIRFRNATLTELGRILDWAAAEGWNPGLDDAAAFYAADPKGFFVATENEAPIAAISVVNHNDNFAFLGLYIVRPSHRGQGIGHSLWHYAIRHAGARTIGLDGVVEQQANYAASGFEHAGGTARYSGRIASETASSIRAARSEDTNDLINREAEASGVRKEAYLSAWFSETPTRKTLIDKDGFCTVRKCREGVKIGPLFAKEPASALRLMRHAGTVFGKAVVIDVPESADILTSLCEEHGLVPGFKTARMYRGAAPSGSDGLSAVTSLELG